MMASDPLVTQLMVAAVGLISAGTTALNHVKGKKRDQEDTDELETIKSTMNQNHGELVDMCHSLELELHDLNGVIGIDTDNGLRGDVKGIKSDMKLMGRDVQNLQTQQAKGK